MALKRASAIGKAERLGRVAGRVAATFAPAPMPIAAAVATLRVSRCFVSHRLSDEDTNPMRDGHADGSDLHASAHPMLSASHETPRAPSWQETASRELPDLFRVQEQRIARRREETTAQLRRMFHDASFANSLRFEQ